MLIDILNFLNKNSGAIGVIFSCLVTIATVVYAVLTWKLVSETRKMRKAQTDAKVSVRVQPHKDDIHAIQLIVANEGIGPAYDVEFALISLNNLTIELDVLKEIKSHGYFSRGIEYLSPNQQIISFLPTMTNNVKVRTETAFNIEVSYKTSSGERIKDLYLIDMSIFKGLNRLNSPNISSIVEELKKIQYDFSKIASNLEKI